MATLQKEFNYYIKNREELVKNYEGKYLVIKDEQILGVYDTQRQAIKETMKDYELGTFMVHLVKPGDDDIKRTFRSRVLIHAKN